MAVRLPQPTAERSLPVIVQAYPARPATAQTAGIEMQFDPLCLLRCAGGALSCIACGTNIPCWIGCAGPQVVNCVADCF
jgi:hypothetical protein